ncbi:MAG: DUF883 domain-containing protein [Steroidobacteraceae bacterium]
MENLLSDVGDLLTRLSHVKNRDIARVRDKVQDTLESARDTLSDTAASLSKKGRKAVASTDDYVHGSPWQAVGVAALVGFAIGYLVSESTQ